MAGVLSIYVAAEANAEPTVVMHLHPEGLALPDLAALGLRLGAMAMAEAGKPPWFPAPDREPAAARRSARRAPAGDVAR